MAVFTYTARDAKGTKVSGRVEAKDKNTAAALLQARNLVIVNLREQGRSGLAELQAMTNKVKTDEVVTMTRQLATMLEAGLPLVQALSLLTGQAQPALQKILQGIVRQIEGGETFGKSLQKHDKVFSQTYRALVEAGEAAGALDTILVRLADSLEKQKEFRAKTKGALIYPIIVVLALLGVVTIMMIFVVPQMTTLYADFGADLPVTTQVVIDISNFMRNQWYILLGGIGAAIAGVRFYQRTPAGRKNIDQLMLKIPLVGKLRTQVLLTDFSRTLSLLVNAGVSLLTALEIATNGVTNELFRDALKVARGDVEKGRQLSAALEKQQIFPPLLTQMAAVGEATGQLDSVLDKVAKYYESESEHAVKNLTTALEPLIMVVLGVGVGFLIVAIVMPIYSLTSQF